MDDAEDADRSDLPDVGAGDGGESELPVRDWWSEPDGDLQLLVALANRFDIEIGIRLFVPSGVLSGSLIGMSTYFSRLAAALRAAGGEDEGSVTSVLAGTYDDVSARRRSDLSDGELDSEVRHIHVDRATLHIPGSEPLTIGLWRGRLAEVAGWSLGSYGTAENPGR